MKTPRECSKTTRKKLLVAAVDVFAEKGYRDATIAAISERAKANIAAVNYHFGDKETLYREAWRYAFSESIKAHPPDAGLSDAAPPEERLRGHITALLRRVSDKKNKAFLMVQKEMTNPTGLLDEIMREMILPLQKMMQDTIRELIGSGASDMQVRFCEISIISQCINPMVFGRGDDAKGPPRIKDLKSYADHVVQFSLAGIQEYKKDKKGKDFRDKESLRCLRKGNL